MSQISVMRAGQAGGRSMKPPTALKAPDVSRQIWAQKIIAAWRKTLVAIFETGDLLIAAKAEIGHGDWIRLCEGQLPFKIGTAQRLMQIAADRRLRNTATGPHLPPYWRTLYELTRWSDEALARALRDGRIHPEMSKADAANLLIPKSGPPAPILRALGRPMRPPSDYPYDPDVGQLFLEFLETYFPTVPKIEIFRRTAPRKCWQAWGVEITECPGTRTLKLKVAGEHFIIRLPIRAPADLDAQIAKAEHAAVENINGEVIQPREALRA